MKALVAVLSVLALAGAFAAGRFTSPELALEGHRQPISLLEQALDDENLLTRSYKLSLFLQGLGPDAIEETIELLEAERVGITEYELQVFMLAWASFDAAAAFEWANSYPNMWRQTLMRAAMYAWGFQDPQGAVAALEGVSVSQEKRQLFDALITAWSRGDDKAGVSEFIASQPPSGQRAKAVQALVAMIGRDGEQAVIDFADAVPEDAPGDYKQVVFGAASGVVSKADPKRAASWYETHRGKPYVEGSLVGISRRWAMHHDPAELFEWLRGLEDAEDRAEAMNAGFQMWLREDPAEASAWLEVAGPMPEADAAIRSFVRKSYAKPMLAVSWAGRIQDPEMRRKALVQAGQRWLGKDPESARAWLEQSGLEEQVQREILSRRQAARRAPRAPRGSEGPMPGRGPRRGAEASLP